MKRYLFVFLMLIHGLIHTMGFIKAFGITPIEQLTQDISKPLGILWLVIGISFIVISILILLKKGIWIYLILPTLVISQILIVMYWKDALFGTIPNIIGMIGVMYTFIKK